MPSNASILETTTATQTPVAEQPPVSTDPIQSAAYGMNLSYAHLYGGVNDTPVAIDVGKNQIERNQRMTDLVQRNTDASKIDAFARRSNLIIGNQASMQGEFLSGLGTEDQAARAAQGNQWGSKYADYVRYEPDDALTAAAFSTDLGGGSYYASQHQQIGESPGDIIQQRVRDRHNKDEHNRLENVKKAIRRGNTPESAGMTQEERGRVEEEINALQEILRWGDKENQDPGKDYVEWSGGYTHEELMAGQRNDPQRFIDMNKEFVASLEEKQDAIASALDAGNEEEADRLIAERDAMFDDPRFDDESGSLLREAIQQTGLSDPTVAANKALGTPTAQLAGGQILRSSQLQDRGGEAYQDELSDYVAPSIDALEANRIRANRVVSNAMRRTRADQQAGRLRPGVARDPLATRELLLRLDEFDSTQRAQIELDAMEQTSIIYGEATKHLNEYVDQLAVNSVQLGLAYTENEPVIGDQIAEALLAVQLAATNFSVQNFQTRMQSFTNIRGAEIQNKSQGTSGWEKADIILGGTGAIAGAGASLTDTIINRP